MKYITDGKLGDRETRIHIISMSIAQFKKRRFTGLSALSAMYVHCTILSVSSGLNFVIYTLK